MSITQNLTQGQILNNQDLQDIFGCSPQGGMRRSLKTNTLVIVSNHIESIYDDRWIDGIFHYTGTGRIGDQSLTFQQNKTLTESNTNGVEVHLFEVDVDKEYKYQGIVQLSGTPYEERQPDDEGNDRKVYVFPLILKDSKPITYTVNEFNTVQKKREKKAKRLSIEELKEKAKKAPSKVGERSVQGIQYERDPYVALLTKLRANGICDLCKEPGPFKDKNGDYYLESHHIEWLSKGGLDTPENTVALCPNCHRKVHVLNNEEDVMKLKNHLKETHYPD